MQLNNTVIEFNSLSDLDLDQAPFFRRRCWAFWAAGIRPVFCDAAHEIGSRVTVLDPDE